MNANERKETGGLPFLRVVCSLANILFLPIAELHAAFYSRKKVQEIVCIDTAYNKMSKPRAQGWLKWVHCFTSQGKILELGPNIVISLLS